MAGIFCAIDTPDLEKAKSLAGHLSQTGVGIKLGLEFFVAQGNDGAMRVREAALPQTPLFLDLKFHDIPNTVKGAVRSVIKTGPSFLTVHASGGREMMEAALEAASLAAHPPVILAVTVLTHLDADALQAVGQGAPQEQVLRLAHVAVKAGVKGVVCSPQEIETLRREFGSGLTLVVPGIRPKGSAAGDQKRIMTPEEAVKAGADWLVIGRPITDDQNPAEAALKIVKSVEKERLGVKSLAAG